MKKYRLLYAEDEEITRVNIAEYIKIIYENIEVYEASNGQDAWDIYLKFKPDIILTDINMDKISGLDLIEKIRRIDNFVKIIVLSAYSDKEKLLRAIRFNLVDYKIKPINRSELGTILDGILRNFQNDVDTQKIYLSDDCFFDKSDDQLYNNKEIVKLTKKEKILIDLLIKNKNTVVDSEMIHNLLWDFDSDFNINAIRTIVKKVRKKLPENVIENIYGGGYKLVTLN